MAPWRFTTWGVCNLCCFDTVGIMPAGSAMAIGLGGDKRVTEHSSVGSCSRQPSEPSQYRNNWNSLMSKEFEKLEALLSASEPSGRDPPVDRGEAAKLAARWCDESGNSAPCILRRSGHRQSPFFR